MSRLWTVFFAGLFVFTLAHAADPKADTLTYDEIGIQIDVARQLRALDCSKDQFTALLKIADRVALAQDKFRSFRGRDDVRAALQKCLDAAIAGGDDEAIWRPLEPFSEEYSKIEQAAKETATQGAQEAVALLSTQQFARLVLAQMEAPSELMNQLTEHRAIEPAAWRDWRDETVRNLAARATGAGDQPPPDEAIKSLTQFFDRMRNTPTDDYFAKLEGMERELRATLRELVSQNLNEDRRNGVVGTLETWITTKGFSEVVRKLATRSK